MRELLGDSLLFGGQSAIRVLSVWAGEVFEGVLSAGECVRIMTGAVVPDGAKLVVMQESTEVVDAGVWVDNPESLRDGVSLK